MSEVKALYHSEISMKVFSQRFLVFTVAYDDLHREYKSVEFIRTSPASKPNNVPKQDMIVLLLLHKIFLF